MKLSRLVPLTAVVASIAWVAVRQVEPQAPPFAARPTAAAPAPPAAPMPVPPMGEPEHQTPPEGLSATEWEGVVAQIRAVQRAFQSAPDQHLHAVGSGGERLQLAPDGTATVSLRPLQAPADPAAANDPVVRTAGVASLSGPAVSLSLKSTAAGRGRHGRPLATGPAVVAGQHLAERSLGTGITEWWRSDERGFEFGWTLTSRPGGDGELTVEMAVDCPWPGTVGADGTELAFADPAGSGWRLACRGLVARDATGRELPARMTLAANTLAFHVADTAAQYPVVIDPWIIAEAPVTVNATAPQADGLFGYAVTLGGDTLAVTAKETEQLLSFHLFTREGATYQLRRSVPHLFYVGPALSGRAAAVCGDTVVAGPFVSLVPVPGGLDFFYAAFERNAGGSNAWASVQEFHFTVEQGGIGTGLHSSSIGMAPDTLVLGYPFALDMEQGDRVKVYHRDPANLSLWVEGPGLTGMDMTGVQGFGLSVDVDGPVMVVGNYANTDIRLAVFRESGGHWQFERQVPTTIGWFYGYLPPVGLSGDTLAVGLQLAGEVRIFERDAGGAGQWGLVRSVTGPADSKFGARLALEGDLLVVGSPGEDIDHDANPGTPAIASAGAVRSYGRHSGGYNAWGQTGILHKGAAAKANGDYGSALSLDGVGLAVGYAEGDSVSPAVVDAGVVEVYTAVSGTVLRLTVANPFGANGIGFGNAVALDGPYLLVGAPLYDPAVPGAASGAAFLFRDRVLVKQWLGQASGDHFGAAVAIERDRVAIGAPRRAGSVGGTAFGDLGTVYIYERNQGAAENWGVARILTPDAVGSTSPSPQFGSSLALGGDSLVVGSPYEDPLVLIRRTAGRVRVFERNQGGADNWGQVKVLSGTDAGAAELFGYAVDLSGDTLAVGAPGETVTSLASAGGGHVFRRNQGGADNWGRVTRLTAPSPAADAFFGYTVALDGNQLGISAPGEARGANPNAGATYLWSTGVPDYDLWSFDSRLQPEDLVANHQFGVSLGLSRGLLVVGAPNSSAAEPSAAAVWLYARTDEVASPWAMVAKSTTPDPDALGTAVAIDGAHFVATDPTADVVDGALQVDRGEVYEWTQVVREWAPLRARSGYSAAVGLGSAVALWDDLLVAGAPLEAVGGQAEAGAAYVFRKGDLALGGWLLNQHLTDTDGNVAGARFGSSLAMDPQWLAVGSPGAQRVSLFTRGVAASPAKPWAGVLSLTVAPAQADGFGTSLALADGRLLVGAPQRSGGGAAFLFERNQGGSDRWGQIDQLTASDAAAGDAFGHAVALNPGVAVVGAPFDDHTAGADAGSVYVFSRNNGGGNTWGQVRKLTLPTQAAGDELGSAVAIADFLVLAGMPGADTSAGNSAGSAVLFARNFGGADNYGLIKTFTAADGNGQARFGTAVALDTTHAIVGAPFADPGGRINAGELYVFSRNYGGTDSWGLLQVAAPEELPAGSQFGMALALAPATLAAGAPFAPMGQSQGVVEIYSFRARAIYDEWAASWGLHGASGVPLADPDGDGQENILELYFGTDPGDGASCGTTPAYVGGGYLIVTFAKSCGCQGIGTLVGETSPDLQSWTPATPAQIRLDSDSFLQLQIPIVAGQKKFVRFRAEVP